MTMISFAVQSKDEARTIAKIAQRAVEFAKRHGAEYDFMTADMDITACHVNSYPLKLNDLLAADDANFAHDVFGIRRHINRETGQLEDCFVPRYAEQQ
jgi:hypothetical protein